jgi:hypothetical protein
VGAETAVFAVRFAGPSALGEKRLQYRHLHSEEAGSWDFTNLLHITLPPANRSGGHLLTGHKWFCAAPMSDAQLTLAQNAHGLSCFLVPRWLSDGNPNTGFRFTRLKQKLGGHCNAWAELELNNGWGKMVGKPGEGLEMIAQAMHHTRLDATISAAATMRQSLAHNAIAPSAVPSASCSTSSR